MNSEIPVDRARRYHNFLPMIYPHLKNIMMLLNIPISSTAKIKLYFPKNCKTNTSLDKIWLTFLSKNCRKCLNYTKHRKNTEIRYDNIANWRQYLEVNIAINNTIVILPSTTCRLQNQSYIFCIVLGRGSMTTVLP